MEKVTLLSDKKLAAAVRVLPQDARPVANMKSRAGESRRGRAQLIFAGQVNDVVGEVAVSYTHLRCSKEAMGSRRTL